MQDIPFLQQRDQMDCGPTSLSMVCLHYGKHFILEKLRELTEIGKEGVNMLGISDAAEKIGFRTQALQASLQELQSDLKLPVILHWGQNHFVVLYKTRRNFFYIADPARGILKLNAAEVSEKWLSSKDESGERTRYPAFIRAYARLLQQPI